MFLQEFLKKEFSEENILFWQACEYFSHVPATDKKQVSRKWLCALYTVVPVGLADHDIVKNLLW